MVNDMKKAKYTVGQKLWFAPLPTVRWMGSPREVSIISVGRKWIELNIGYRVSIDDLSLSVNNSVSPGRCYLSKEEWEAERSLANSWAKLKAAISNAFIAPNDVSVEDIEKARALLRI